MNSPVRTVVFAYSEVGYRCLNLLLEKGISPVAIFTHVDQPGEVQWFRSVRELAESADLQIYTPEKLPVHEWLPRFQSEIRPDLIFSFYYRRMIPSALLATAPLGAFNMHGSLLPKYRGKAPVNWCVLNGETKTGASLHHMVKDPDAGDLVDQEAVAIGPRDSAKIVMEGVTEAAVRVLARQLPALLEGKAPRIPQNHHEATYFGGRSAEDGRIDWQWTTAQIFNLIRAVTHPYPGAFADLPGKGRVRIWWGEPTNQMGNPGTILSDEPLIVATSDSAIRLTEYEPIES
jgi:methionyl-tRNA formyltransferase